LHRSNTAFRRAACIAAVFAIVLALGKETLLQACNIPVFRYALERWNSDDYELIVFHNGELAAASIERLKSIEAAQAPQKLGSVLTKNGNLRIVRVRLDSIDASSDGLENHRKYWEEKLKIQHLKQLNEIGQFAVLRTSRIAEQTIELWHGKLEEFQFKSAMNSPVRTELCRRLMRGDAIVWLVLKSRQSAKNEAVTKLLSQKCKELSRTLELPDGIGLPGSELYSDAPLLLDFSTLEFDSESEPHLAKLFSKLDPLSAAADEPLIIPVFGRGRALEVIPGNRLDSGMIGDLAVFLSGACSCQVKERNPGFDLLLNFNWHKELFGDGASPPPPDEGLKANSPRKPNLLEIPSGKKK
jgi:hypothetical protein